MSVATGGTDWVVRPLPRLAPRLRLFCIPYAGGAASVFSPWPAALPAWVEVCAIQMPGRQRRMAEPPILHLPTLIDELQAGLQPYLKASYAIFGNCTGSLIAFELARRLSASERPPAGLFVSCCRAPRAPDPDPPVHGLDDDGIVAELDRLGGTPREIIEHPELLALLLPTLRADFELAETYNYAEAPPLAAPIFAIGGLDDPIVSREQIEGWRTETQAGFELEMVSGDHYLIESSREALLAKMSADLEMLLDGGAGR